MTDDKPLSPSTSTSANEMPITTDKTNDGLTTSAVPGVTSEVKILDIEVKKVTVCHDIRSIYGHVYPHDDLSKLVMKELTEGAMNCMYKCSLVNQPERVLIVRLYNFRMDTSQFSNKEESLQNRDLEFESMCQASQLGICAQVFARFRNGIAYKYFDGSTLKLEQVHDIELGRKIAQQVARLHTLRIENRRTKQPTQMMRMRHDAMPQFIKMFETIQTKIDMSSVEEYKFLPKLLDLNNEINQIENRLEAIGWGPITFCHNDLNLSNILFDSVTGQVKLLDFEWAEMNPSLVDIAVHFASFAGFFLEDYDNSLLPNEQYRKEWIRHYWTELNRLDGRQMTATEFDELVEQTLIKVNVFMQVVKLNYVIRAPIWDFRPESDEISGTKRNPNNIALYCLKALTGFRMDKEHAEQLLVQLEQKVGITSKKLTSTSNSSTFQSESTKLI